MAFIQHIYICSFLLAIIAGHEFLCTEGRELRTSKKQNFNSFEDDKGLINHSKEPIESKQVTGGGRKEFLPPNGPKPSPEFGSSLGVYVNGFQPTTPGNSPGVGHSYTGRKEEIKQKAPSITPGLAHSVEGNTDDFRPTAPGRSPGVGHSMRNTRAEPNA